MKLHITIECDNAAFCDPDSGDASVFSREREISRILYAACDRDKFSLRAGDELPLHDVNGNRVGEIRLEA